MANYIVHIGWATFICFQNLGVSNSQPKNKKVKAAITKISKHCWYLYEELVAHSFFDDRIPLETKKCMVMKLLAETDEKEPMKNLFTN